MSPWKAAMAWTIPILVLLFTGISYFGWREHQEKEREVKKCQDESRVRDEMKEKKEAALQARESLKAELARRKALYDEDWKKALIYPDWRKEKFQPARVIINHEINKQNNSDPERKENPREETQDPSLSNNQGDHNLIKLDQEEFTSGRYYWEVDVVDTDEWSLGVYETASKGTGKQKKILRVLEKKGNEYRALTRGLQKDILQEHLVINKCPEKIAIFLDYEDSDVSFYNMTDGAHIFSFTDVNFIGPLYPYFKLKSMERT